MSSTCGHEWRVTLCLVRRDYEKVTVVAESEEIASQLAIDKLYKTRRGGFGDLYDVEVSNVQMKEKEAL